MADKFGPSLHVYAEEDLRHLLAREVQRATRYQDFLSLCLIRVTSPAPSSAQARASIVRQIVDLVRSTDLVGSIGEDIAVLLVHTPDTDASMIATRIRERVDHLTVPDPSGAVALRIGLACFPVDGTRDDVLLACAQARLEAGL